MEVIFERELKDLDGNDIPDQQGKPTTLRNIATNSIVAMFQDEKNIGGEEKLKRWDLALKVKNTSDPVSLTVEELALVKNMVAKAYGTLIVGQAWKMLEEGK